MARSSFRALDQLDLLDIDSLLFISEHADENAGGQNQSSDQRSNGFANTGRAAEAAIGLEIAVEAPAGVAADPETSDLPDTGPFLSFVMGGALGDDLELVLASSHRDGHGGGGPGGGGPGGGGGGGGGGSTEPLTYYKAGGKDKGPNDKYNIEIDFIKDGWTLELQQAFIAAADYLTSIITDGLGDVLTNYPYTGQIIKIDDLRFTAELYPGEKFGVLGYGGPYIYTDYSLMPREQPYMGLMGFDSADTDWLLNGEKGDLTGTDGLWDEVVLHEMLHVLGVGTIWEPMGKVAESANSDIGWVFTGENAIAEYLAMFPDEADLIDQGWTDVANDGTVFNDVDGVPIQEVYVGPGVDGIEGNDDDEFAAGGHWREIIFGDELMTPSLNGAADLTDLTLASLSDLGYTVDEGALLA
jgi:hypothetical protein